MCSLSRSLSRSLFVSLFLFSSLSLLGACGSKPPGGLTPLPTDCAPATYSFALSYFAEPTRFFPEAGPAPFLSEGRLYASRTAGVSNSVGDLEIFSVEAQSGASTALTSNDSDDVLLDANAGALLFTRRSRTSPSQTELVYRDARGERMLGERSVTLPLDLGDTRLVNASGAAWSERNAIFHYDGTRVREVSAGLRNVGTPFLFGTAVLFTAFTADGTRAIYRYFQGETKKLSDGPADRDPPVMSLGYAYWLSRGRVMRQTLQETSPAVVDPGPCYSLSTSGGHTLFGCDAPGATFDGNGGFARTTKRVRWFDGMTVRDVPTLGGFVAEPRIDRGRMTWFEFAEQDATCRGNTSGEVVFWGGDARTQPSVVGATGAPCLCCGAYWPPLVLRLENDVVAWNYGVSAGAEPRQFELAYAVVREERLCAR